MVRKVTFQFDRVEVGPSTAEGQERPRSSRGGVFRIFDINGNLILLEKTHDLSKRLARFYGNDILTRSPDLQCITGRVEFCPTDNPLESLYLLNRERRHWFPSTYLKMRTFRRFHLLKVNRRQRFPRIYATRQLKRGVDYFGPFQTRAELDRMKASLERTFKIRPCRYNIRGSDPYPDCLYFQTRGCSRPCNDDITRSSYLRDIDDAIAFIQGREDGIVRSLFEKMQALAADTRFEEAERLRRRIERIRRSREENAHAYFDLSRFDFVAIMDTRSVKRRKIAIVRSGCILGFEEHTVDDIESSLLTTLETAGEPRDPDKAHRYEEFCIVSTFIVKPVRSVRLVPLAEDPADTVRSVLERLKS